MTLVPVGHPVVKLPIHGRKHLLQKIVIVRCLFRETGSSVKKLVRFVTPTHLKARLEPTPGEFHVELHS
jgi:hypothetical protein